MSKRRSIEPFVDKIVARVRALRQGPSKDEVDLGCMTSEAQLQKVAAQVDEAIAARRQGARPADGAIRTCQGIIMSPRCSSMSITP